MRRLMALTAVLLSVVLALVACGGGAKPEPTAVPAAAQPAAATAAPSQAGSKPTAAPTAAPAAAEEALPVLKPGALKSYVAKVEVKSEVVVPEPGVEAWSETEMTYRLDPAPVAFAMVIKDKTQQGRPDMQTIGIGEAFYYKNPEEETWMKLPSNAGGLGAIMQTLINPEELTKDAPVDVFTASNVVNRNETVDGVATTHYRATEA